MTIRVLRMRMTVGDGRDVSSDAWDAGKVGIWYGAWSADEWRRACRANPSNPGSILDKLPHQEALDWGPLDIFPVWRFEGIGPDDWVLVYLRDRAEFGLAQLEPEMLSDETSEFNHSYPERNVREVFKYRRTRNSKTFRIAELPDAYHLLASQGRSNIHELHGMGPHVRLLAESADVGAVRTRLGAMPTGDLIDFMGAYAWESLCTAYLVLEHGFVPTGPATGRTLPIFDIVGRRMQDGAHILAQCKKAPGKVAMDDAFVVAIGAHRGQLVAFYFAYGGCREEPPPRVEVFGRAEMLRWMADGRGDKYRQLLLGG